MTFDSDRELAAIAIGHVVLTLRDCRGRKWMSDRRPDQAPPPAYVLTPAIVHAMVEGHIVDAVQSGLSSNGEKEVRDALKDVVSVDGRRLDELNDYLRERGI